MHRHGLGLLVRAMRILARTPHHALVQAGEVVTFDMARVGDEWIIVDWETSSDNPLDQRTVIRLALLVTAYLQHVTKALHS
jgi:hypothetical protein